MNDRVGSSRAEPGRTGQRVRPTRDLIAVKRWGKDRLGEVQLALPNDAHTWYYIPTMRIDEALLIKTYDSNPTMPTRSAIHSAFDDPATPAEVAPRESIETSCFVFFD